VSGKPLIYIMGPYSKGGQARNVRRAIEAAEVVCSLGGVPFIPHLCHFWDLLYPRTYEFWLDYDITWLERCHAAYRIPGESEGADREEKRCNELKIPVFRTTPALMKFLDDWRSSRGYYSA